MKNLIDEKHMHECLNLAKKGQGFVSPNPMVGCVVLNKDGKVVSTGYHKKYGENHAERDALLKLKNKEAEGGTLYVNLEPCSHYGKTPPCVDLIIEHKISRVVIGMKDPNPKVDGISKLKSAGIEVCINVLKDECEFLNRIFIKNITKNLPYVVLKTATTMDGKISTQSGSSKWITSDKSRRLVYEMRENFDCILTSSNTVISDNPNMIHKFKCILDKNNRVDLNSNIFKQGEVFIANRFNTNIKNDNLDLNEVLSTLYKKGICSVFVECGGTLAGAFLKEDLVDEIYQFIAPKITNDNSSLSCFNGNSINNINECKNLRIYETQFLDPDILIKSIVV